MCVCVCVCVCVCEGACGCVTHAHVAMRLYYKSESQSSELFELVTLAYFSDCCCLKYCVSFLIAITNLSEVCYVETY